MATNQQEWPNRGGEILGSTVSVAIMSAIFLVWRIVYGVMNKRKILLCDYLLVLAAVCNLTTTGLRFKTVEHGLGRHFRDPSIKFPADILDYSYYLFVSQILNLLGVSLLKYSICAYLLALKFSLVYTIIIWISIAMVTAFNFLSPLLGNLSCTPFEKNWNKGLPGKCWYKGSTGLTYMQGVSNILTDIVYVVSPIIYLSSVQLPRRTQWGLRVVFLLGLVATICSIFKTIELSALRKTKNPTWDGVNLTIWSSTELSVGILIASLPPLRKQFDRMFRLILPTTFQTKSKTPGNSIPLYNVSKPMGRSGVHDDGDSEQHILPEDMHDGKIVKTVVHEITNTERSDKTQGPTRTHSTYGKMSG